MLRSKSNKKQPVGILGKQSVGSSDCYYFLKWSEVTLGLSEDYFGISKRPLYNTDLIQKYLIASHNACTKKPYKDECIL